MESLKKILSLFEFIDSSDYNDSLGNDTLEKINELLPIHSNEFKNEIYGKNNVEKIDILKQYISLIYLKNEWIEFYKWGVTTKENRAFTLSEIMFFEIYESLIQYLGIICLPYNLFLDEILIEMRLPIDKINLWSYLKEKAKYSQAEFNQSIDDNINLYPFKDKKAKEFFKIIFDFYKNEEFELANFSFVYWKMIKDGIFINGFKPELYRSWLLQEYNLKLKFQIKTLDRCKTLSKENKYTELYKAFFS